MTKYAKQILEIVQTSRSHLTADQVFLQLREVYPKVALASVCEEGLVRRVPVEGMPDRYDRMERHDHLVCKECGRLADVDLGDLTSQLEQAAGLSILSYDLKLVYLCEECRKKLQEKGM